MTSTHTFFGVTGLATILLINLTGCSTTTKTKTKLTTTSYVVKVNHIRPSTARRHIRVAQAKLQATSARTHIRVARAKYTSAELQAASARKSKYIQQHKQRRSIATANRVVWNAKKQLNKPYIWGAANPNKGFDCSGLVKYCYLKSNIKLPRTAAVQYKASKKIPQAHARKGDLVFFRTKGQRGGITHVGIYLGGNKFIHAPRAGKRVSIANLNAYWTKRLAGFGRVTS